MKSNTKEKLILICLGALISLSFVFSSNNVNYPVRVSEGPVRAIGKGLQDPPLSTNGAFKIYWDANGTALTDSEDVQNTGYNIISDGQGGAIIAFTDDRAGVNDIYAQRVSPAGERLWGQNGTVICNATNAQELATLCTDDAGGAIITWKDLRNGVDTDIYAQHVDSDGTTHWGESFWSGPGDLNGTVICNATGDQEYATICIDDAGGAIITWKDLRNGDYDIYAQHVDSDGTTHWGESFWSGPGDLNGTVICNATATQEYPQICNDEAAGAIITWGDDRNGADADIYAQRVDFDGTTHWGESLWSGPGDLNGTVICNATDDQEYPQICSDEVAGVIIIWDDLRSGNRDIYAQRVDFDGTTYWGEFFWSGPGDLNGMVICNATGYQGSAQICEDGARGAIITWEDERTGDRDIYAQRVDFDGTTYWGESFWSGPGDLNGTVICNTTVQNEYNPSICTDGAGGAIIAWEDRRDMKDYIYAQWVSSDGKTHWGDEKSWGGMADLNGTAIFNIEDRYAYLNGYGEYYFTSICSDDSGGAIIAWLNDRDGNFNESVYTQRVRARSMSLGGGLPVGDDNDNDGSIDEPPSVNIIVIIIIIIIIIGIAISFSVVSIKKSKAKSKKEESDYKTTNNKFFKESIGKKRTKKAEMPKTKKTKRSLLLKPVPLTEKEKKELIQTESEVKINKKEYICLVHRGHISGSDIYLCPHCDSFYCERCAKVLRIRGEKCWNCDNEIKLEVTEEDRVKLFEKSITAILKDIIQEKAFLKDFMESDKNLEDIPQIKSYIFSIFSPEELDKIDKVILPAEDKKRFIKELILLDIEEREDLLDDMLKK